MFLHTGRALQSEPLSLRHQCHGIARSDRVFGQLLQVLLQLLSGCEAYLVREPKECVSARLRRVLRVQLPEVALRGT